MCGGGTEVEIVALTGDFVGAFRVSSEKPRVYVHERCALHSPEVAYIDEVWYNVTKALQRASSTKVSASIHS